MLHHILHRLKITPDEFYKKPPGVRSFIRASMRKWVESSSDK